MLPHIDVHRGSDHYGRGGGEIKRRQEIVGDALRELGNGVGGGRSDDQAINALRNRDVLDRALHIRRGAIFRGKHVGDDFASGECGKCEGGDEFLRVARQDRLNFQSFLLEASHQLRGFISRHASRNSDCYAHRQDRQR